MSFLTTIQSVLRKKAVSPKKANRVSLLEPPLLALPQSPKQQEEYYVLDESLTNMSLDDDELPADKTFFENETFEMFTSDTNFRQGKNGSSRKRPLRKMENNDECTKAPISSIPVRLFQDEAETIYSPPAKRAPILRKIRSKLSMPHFRPPRIPLLMEDDENPYVTFKSKSGCSKTKKPVLSEMSRL
ncbi:unnamed protein product [Cylicocyclus nassatus]|uniref:Uncharacterized protein n=1 Tax=Cylicocyclus nassatus TaxID=53992 RepID=A0AA36GKR7_CYLNA|nr:unnamed protein product [Cylicocyclus nassatus]